MAGTLATGYGGTGLTSYTAGDIVYYATGTALSKLAIGTNGQVITSSGTAPQWTNQSSLSVGSATTATNLAGGAAGSIPYQSGAGATTFLASGTGVIKYLCRWRSKNGIADLEKARHYIDMLIELETR